MKNLKKYWPEVVATITLVWSVAGPQIQAEVAKHPEWSAVIGIIAVICARLSPSPIAPAKS